MLEGIAAVIEFVATAWEYIKDALRLSRFVTWIRRIRSSLRNFEKIACAISWYFYVRQIELVFKWLRGLGVSPSLAAEWLGITRIIDVASSDTERTIIRQLTHNRELLESNLEVAKEIEVRRKLPESRYNGVHKPPYKSKAILEVHFHFDNILQSGTMILFFNPEGFGNKPRIPQIVRFVSEQEFGDFLKGMPSSERSNSWGMFWRVNYLLRAGGKGSLRHRTGRYSNYDVDNYGNYPVKNIETVDIAPSTVDHEKKYGKDFLTNEEKPLGKVENLDDYIANTLELDEEQGDILSESMGEFIQNAVENQLDIEETMIGAIENSTWGRGLEQNGLRVTSAVSDKVRNIPKNLQRIVSGNPVFRDVAKVTSVYRKSVGRWRYLRDVWEAKKLAKTYSAETLAISGSLGQGVASTAALGRSMTSVLDLLSGQYTEIVRAVEAGAPLIEVTELNDVILGLEEERKALGSLSDLSQYEEGSEAWKNAKDAWMDAQSEIAALTDDIEEGLNKLANVIGTDSRVVEEIRAAVGKNFIQGLITPPKCSFL